MRLWYCAEDAYAIANFLYSTAILLRSIIFSLISPLGSLGFARENIRIMTDEYSPWYPPTKENIVSPPCEVLLLLLPSHLISKGRWRHWFMTRDPMTHSSFIVRDHLG